MIISSASKKASLIHNKFESRKLLMEFEQLAINFSILKVLIYMLFLLVKNLGVYMDIDSKYINIK